MTDGIITTSSNGSAGAGGRLDARKFPPRYEESRYHFLAVGTHRETIETKIFDILPQKNQIRTEIELLSSKCHISTNIIFISISKPTLINHNFRF